MTPLSEALTTAQKRALAALEKAYVAGQIDGEQFSDKLELAGISDPIDIAFLICSLDVLREWGVQAPTMTERVAEAKDEPMTGKQQQYLLKLAREKNVHMRPGFEGMTKQQASEAIEQLQSGVYDEQTDVPF